MIRANGRDTSDNKFISMHTFFVWSTEQQQRQLSMPAISGSHWIARHENSPLISNYILQLYFCSRVFPLFLSFYFVFAVTILPIPSCTNCHLKGLPLYTWCAPLTRHTIDRPASQHSHTGRKRRKDGEWRKCIGRLGFVSIESLHLYTCALSSGVITRYGQTMETIIFFFGFFPLRRFQEYTHARAWSDDTHFQRLVYRFRFNSHGIKITTKERKIEEWIGLYFCYTAYGLSAPKIFEMWNLRRQRRTHAIVERAQRDKSC